MDLKLIAIVVGVFGAIIGCYVWVAKHIANSKKHPCKTDIVFKDVCEEKTKRIEDCLESEIKNLGVRFGEFKETVENGFTEVKKLIRDDG